MFLKRAGKLVLWEERTRRPVVAIRMARADIMADARIDPDVELRACRTAAGAAVVAALQGDSNPRNPRH